MSDRLSRRSVIAGAATGAAFIAIAGVGASSADEPAGLRVIAELVAKPETADQLRQLLVPFAKSARMEPGCLEYVLMEVQGEAGRFLTYEIWTNRAALDAHMKAPALVAAGPKLIPLLAKPFTQTFLDALT
jgi:quinol monooxygenase YgiN